MINSESLFVYARLLNEDGQPIEVTEMPSVFSIASSCLGLGRYVRVVGHVPAGFAYLPGGEHYYKVELDPSDESVRLWLEGSNRLPGCSIDKIDIQLENSVRHNDIPGALAASAAAF